VVISKILPDPINAYLKRFVLTIVDQINGVQVKTLEDLAEAFAKPSEFYVIRVVGDPQPLVLEGRVVAEARRRIRERYSVVRETHLADDIVPPEWLANRPVKSH
jgi:disulfide oxidoreductase YuzD